MLIKNFNRAEVSMYFHSNVNPVFKHMKFVGIVVLMVLTAMSCSNHTTLKSVGTIDLDTMMVRVKPLIVLTIYRNEVLPEKYAEIHSTIAEEYADKANASNWLLGDYDGGIFHINQREYEKMVEKAASKSYNIAWEEIQYIAKNNVSKTDFPFGDIEDECANELIQYYFDTIENVDSRIVLSEPKLIKDEEKYATFIVTNTMTQTDYLIKLTDATDNDYFIEVSEK